jgi:hypothetical protein
VSVEIRDVAPGLWLWRQRHPSWKPGEDWEGYVSSFAAESRGVKLVIDALAPPADAAGVWRRLDEHAPGVALVLKPDHVRDIDLFVRRYGVTAYGPHLFWRDDIPRSELSPIFPGDVLPGGVLVLRDARERLERPVYLPEQRAIVFADGMSGEGGVLRPWATAWHEERVLPALRELLDLDFEHVLVSHGEPVHTRADFEAALEREPWSG